MELTQEQIDRQDFVDNAIHELACNLTGSPVGWDIEGLGKIRDAVQEVIVDDLKLMTEQEFYPFIAE